MFSSSLVARCRPLLVAVVFGHDVSSAPEREKERLIKVKKTVLFSSFIRPLCPRENGREKKREEDEDAKTSFGTTMIVDSSADDAVAFAALADEDIERSIKPNFYQQYREIRKKNEDVLNRLRSIFVDYAFVEETIETLGVTNVFANLRCGAWYTDLRKAKTCTFKSIDGHNLNHQFSQSRLNTHVLLEASRCESSEAIIVDTTKSKTKRFPDALAKTVPIWCATINRACGVIEEDARIEKDEFPDFVSENELRAIETKMSNFVEAFVSVVSQKHFAEIKRALDKSGPLQCEYVCRNNAEDVIARRKKRKEKKATVLYLLSASMPLSKSGQRCKLELGKNTVSYNYFPGAADDEESWALHLSPKQFQRHMDKFVSCESAKACESLIRKVVQRGGEDDDENTNEDIFVCLKDVLHSNVYVGTFQALLNDANATMREGSFHAVLYVGSRYSPNFSVKREDLKAYLHVPMKFAKQKRGDIEKKLPICVEFLMRHVVTTDDKNAGVFVCCDDAKDLSNAVIAAFQLVKNGIHLRPPEDFTKETVRKVLADIASPKGNPIANPCQGTVKQIYAYLLTLIKKNKRDARVE